MLEWARILLRATHKAPTYSHVVDLPSTMCESVEPLADGSHFRWDAIWDLQRTTTKPFVCIGTDR